MTLFSRQPYYKIALSENKDSRDCESIDCVYIKDFQMGSNSVILNETFIFTRYNMQNIYIYMCVCVCVCVRVCAC